MARFLASLAVVAGLGIAVLAAACASQGDRNDATPVDTEHVIDPECLATLGSEFPAQHPEPASPERISELTRILCGEDAVKAMVAGRAAGRDLWIRVSYVYEYREANNSGEFPIAMVNFYFDPPVSYSGEVAVEADPCTGHYGADERLDPDDTCMDAPHEYGRRLEEFAGATGVVAQVDFRRGEVVELFAVPFPVDSGDMADIRSYFGGAAYVSIGDPVQTGDRDRMAGELFRQHLSERLDRSVDWVAFPGGATDEFIDGSGGGISHLDRVASDLAEWRRKGRPVVAITLGIGGDDLVEVGTRCHALGKQSCPDIYGEALTNYVEQLSLILRRLNEAKDPNTPLLLLTYYNASDCAQGGVELSPEELGVQGWNQAIIAAARANGAYLADIYTPFKGHGCEYTSGLRPNEKGHAAIAEVYEEVYDSLPSEFVEPFALPGAAEPTEAATPTLPAEASPTTQATATAAPINLDWEKAEQAAEADNAKPRFRGELGDFAVVEPNSGSNYPCPEPYGSAMNLESSELYFDLPGAVIDSIGTGSCQGTVVSITASVPGELGGAIVGRGYFVGPKMRVSYDAPAERLKLMTVAGKPALATLPIPDCISCLTEVAVIERFPTKGAPGITAWVHTASGLDRAIALVEQIMAAGKE